MHKMWCTSVRSFDEGFDENVGQLSVASTDDENDGQQPHDFDDDPKYPPNNDSSEAPNGDPSEALNGDHGDPSEAPNGDQPSVVVSSARYVNLARVKYYCTFYHLT